MKNKRTFVTLIPSLSANLEETSKPLFSKKCLMEFIIFNNSNFDAI